MDPVQKYLQLGERIDASETKADEYRRRGEADRWEQARLAHEAVKSGAYDQGSFARATGEDRKKIQRLCRIWEEYGGCPLAGRPEFLITMCDGKGETARKQRANAAAVLKDEDEADRLFREHPDAVEPASEAVAKAAGQTLVHALEEDANRHLEIERLLVAIKHEISIALKRLPDYRPTKALKDEAEETGAYCDTFSSFLKDWADGVSIADEVDAWLSEGAA